MDFSFSTSANSIPISRDFDARIFLDNRDLNPRITAVWKIISAIQFAAKQNPGVDGHELNCLAIRIAICNSSKNHWQVPDAWSSETGEAFDAHGQMWRCWSKLCPSCLAEMAKRTRRKLRFALDQQKLASNERFTFATFTIPNPDQSLVVTRSIVARAWKLFQRRKLFVSLIRGGVKSEEFTLTRNGFHYHLHTIFLSKYLHYQEVRRVWTECVAIAFREHGLDFICRNKDGLLSVVIKPVHDREKAIQEVGKYITKSDSWSKISPRGLKEIAMIQRWSRMFELHGSFRVYAVNKTILDTKHLSDGLLRPSHRKWRRTIASYGTWQYAAKLQHDVESCALVVRDRLRRKWPEAKIIAPIFHELAVPAIAKFADAVAIESG